MNISLQAATADDAEAMLEVQIRAFHHDTTLYGVELGGPPGYDSVDNLRQKIAEDLCYKILWDGRIVGGFVVFEKADGHYHLDLITIDPDYHRQGIGSQAIRFMDEVFNAHLWTLDTPLYAIHNHSFYEKHGFKKLREVTVEGDPVTLVEYEKRA